MTKQTINIHGKEYETVASRVQRFREKFPTHQLTTSIEYRDETEVVIKATIADPEGNVLATGHAEEQRQASTINRTSALENAETSAIGRALAAFGYAGTEFASADEVANAIGQQGAQKASTSAKKPAVGSATTAPAPASRKLVTESQIKLLLARSRDASGLSDRQEIYDWFLEKTGVMPNEVHMDEVDDILRVIASGAES